MFLGLIAMLLAGAPQPAVKEITFHGGFLDGLRMTSTTDSKGDQWGALRGSVVAPPALAPQHSAAIHGFLAARHPAKAREFAAFTTADATGSVCPGIGAEGCTSPAPFAGFPFKKKCTARAPYPLEDGTIRLEWTCSGRFKYLSLLTLRCGKVAAVVTKPALPPNLLPSE